MSKRKLTILVSGKKQAGKDSLSRRIICEFLNYGRKKPVAKPLVTAASSGIIYKSEYYITSSPNLELDKLSASIGAKIHSFADPLKKFCIEVLGLTVKQCYGTDDDKNTVTPLKWQDQFPEVRRLYVRKEGKKSKRQPHGYMTAKEVMEVVGTQWCRRMVPNCWVDATYSKIANGEINLNVVADCRFPNELTCGTELGAKAIRLLRNPHDSQSPSELALDNVPDGEYSLIVDNRNIPEEAVIERIRPTLYKWFENYNLV